MSRSLSQTLSRVYFALQSLTGLLWWILVFAVPSVREATLGTLDAGAVAAADLPLFVGAAAVAACGVRSAAVVNALWTVVVAIALAVYATVGGEAGWGVILMGAATIGSLLALSLLLLGRIPTEWIAWGPLAFRPADESRETAVHLAVTAGQIALFWGLFLGVLPWGISVLEQRWGVAVPVPPGVPVAGAVLFFAASVLGLWSAAVMASLGRGTPLPSVMPNHLVIAGPYRWVRNPMALSGVMQAGAVGLMLGSWLVVVYAVGGSVLWNLAIRPLEERDLEARFGDEFRGYRDAVRCWVPRPPRSIDRF
ncbi:MULTISPECIES: isoprenylcysteine carboxylmethyltransferase family protein [Arthrobacter]|uniref:Isoprenylcysteine carboxylmethyltransferase family protein n=2 Tax=Arthrobacter TaxID=1663 RepID=A0ABU9KI50_9MICC|nr:isoprenylcysteine carboxylmethyltransferase family protein [Arthrobacter sp. YJM1]MDP5226408.1 isoprenylcysteine carboxylmethyltransferase family protein [Arthrobacter sp. YJM1]